MVDVEACSHLREIGMVLSDEIDAISDEVILRLWERPS